MPSHSAFRQQILDVTQATRLSRPPPTMRGLQFFQKACSTVSGASLSKVVPLGFVTLPCGEREARAPQELLGRCDCGPPRVHRLSAKHAVRLG